LYQGLHAALAEAGKDSRLRACFLDVLRRAELEAVNAEQFRHSVRWPIVRALIGETGAALVTLANGLRLEVGIDSRIEQSLLLCTQAHPDHVWEPQTTRLLTALAAETDCAIVGGAYIGDQVLFIARAMAARSRSARLHAFEPMRRAYERLLRNLALNGIGNTIAKRTALADHCGTLTLEGPAALASTVTSPESNTPGEYVAAVTIDDYAREHALVDIGFIMLDIEGGEELALRGATALLARAARNAPHVIFEIHRQYVDWSLGLRQTRIVNFLIEQGYHGYAIRDFHDNVSMAGRPIEIIPWDRVCLDGPPHGFNVLATKDAELVARLGLRVVVDVSPKLLFNKNPALHHPLDGMPLLPARNCA
jgi:FkbM family methyltransferase